MAEKHEGEHCWHIMPSDVVCCGCVHVDFKRGEGPSDAPENR